MEQLFARQLAAATSPNGEVDLGVLQELVEETYEQAERDRDVLAKALEDSKHEAERRDPLTGLPNRLAFSERLAQVIDEANASKSQFAVLCIDFDRFKEVNEVFGHAVADNLLRKLAGRLESAAGSAFIARLGSDDFSIIVNEGVQPEASEQLARRVQETVFDGFDIDSHVVRTALSIGIAIYPQDGSDVQALMINAEAALAHAKRDGRGSLRFFEAEVDRQQRERVALQQELGSAIERNELRLFYQPLALINGEITGFEALLRWEHGRRGRIAPNTFIPLAEENGMIIPIGAWVMREACRQAASWPKPLVVAINLSPVQFHYSDLPSLVLSILLETGLPPNRLELEITEGVLMNDFDRAIAILRRLKTLGVSIAVDDFGTGYSSLRYVQAFQFDKIKVDKSFVDQLDESVQSRAIIRAVVGLAHGLGLPVLAEGVETSQQLEFLKMENCDEVQGYLIGRPQPIETYADLIGLSTSARSAEMAG